MQIANAVVRMNGTRVRDANHPWGAPGLDRFSLWGNWGPDADPPRDPGALGAMLLGALPVAICGLNGDRICLDGKHGTFEVPNGIPGSEVMFIAYGVRIVPDRPITVAVLNDHGHRLDHVTVTRECLTIDVAGKIRAEIHLAPVTNGPLPELGVPSSVLERLVPTPA